MKVMSNGSLELTGRHNDDLDSAIRIAMNGSKGVRGWRKTGATLELYETMSEIHGFHPTPYEMDHLSVALMVREWLQSVPDNIRSGSVDIDGSIKPDGFCVRAGLACKVPVLFCVDAVWSLFHK